MKFLKNLMLSALLLTGACNKTNLELKTQAEINAYPSPKKHNLQENKMNNSEIRFGVLGDIHYQIENAKKIAEKFSKMNLDYILINGDLSKSNIDYMFLSEKQGIIDALTPFIELGKPVYCVPGNHESIRIYSETIKELKEKYPNINDLSSLNSVDLNGVNLIGVKTKGVFPSGAYVPDSEIDKINKNNLPQDDDPVLLLSHVPPRFNHREAIDEFFGIKLESGRRVKYPLTVERIIYEGQKFDRIKPKNLGKKELAEKIKETRISFGISGHFHPAYGGCDLEKNIKQGEYSSELFVNPGAVKYLRAGVLTIKGKEAKYELLDLRENEENKGR
ncbi:MAG: metallophosphoesterase family protein [Candidatus Nanoarchaeia archaeon]